jgi:hypothetical protein
MMFLFQWWQVIGSLLMAVSAGFFAGVAWSHSVGYDRGYRHGYKRAIFEIEQASGMHEPVCTCASNEHGIRYICPYHRTNDNVKNEN